MPIFEYTCRACQRRFETLIQSAALPECPDCGGQELNRYFSLFSVGGRGAALAAREPPGPCRSCGDARGPGACALD